MALTFKALQEVICQDGGVFVDKDGKLVQGEALKKTASLGGPQSIPKSRVEANQDCDYEGIFRRRFLNTEHKEGELDDMVWFVANEAGRDTEDVAFIRRKTDPESLPVEGAATIDWRTTLYLNIITQWEYHLTVGVCRSHIQGRKDMVALKWVERRVYAQPSSAEGDHGEHKCTFPQIYFTVDDFNEAFGDIQLEEGHAWCVELVAKNDDQRIPVFRGAVPFEKMSRGLAATSPGLSLSSLFSKKEPREINMRGPGGRGAARAEVGQVEGSSLKCCLVFVKALWVDIAYALENPIESQWMEIPTEEELAEELKLNEEYKQAAQKAEELNKLAKEDEKGSAIHRASQSAKAARASASRFFDGLRDSFNKKLEDTTSPTEQDLQPPSVPDVGTKVKIQNLKHEKWVHLNGLIGEVIGQHPTQVASIVEFSFDGRKQTATVKPENYIVQA
eukprot:TRINITY_DN7058_c0_g1_i1.p1 TRINITY_DN7058_c0_g1~~TRINITY_DN7058_c0_g1_i1.p1  ORF type:complete len:447 (+),score=71.82 TRINITY_DN7058_c0_g1_i1:129-1469(+)